MSLNSARCLQYVKNWDSYREIWEINKDAFIRRYAKMKPATSTFDMDIQRYNEMANDVQKEETFANLHFVRLDCSPLKHALVSHCSSRQSKLTALLNSQAITELHDLHAIFESKSQILLSVPTTLDQFSKILNVLSSIHADVASIQSRFAPLHEFYQILDKYEVQIGKDERMQLDTLQEVWLQFLQTVGSAEKAAVDWKSKFHAELQVSAEEFNRLVLGCVEDFKSHGPTQASFGAEKAQKYLLEFRDRILSLSNQERELAKGLGVFKQEYPPSKELLQFSLDIDILTQVWHMMEEWTVSWSQHRVLTFNELALDVLEKVGVKFSSKIAKILKDPREWDVIALLSDGIKHFCRAIPVLASLSNPKLRTRHWAKLMEELGHAGVLWSSVSLEQWIEWGVFDAAQQIESLSDSANSEFMVEESIECVEKVWAELVLELNAQTHIPEYTASLSDQLQDSQVRLTGLKSSPHAQPFMPAIDEWELKLALVAENIETWVELQRQWLYLVNIFIGAQDIRKQLPKETAEFELHHQLLLDLVEWMASNPNVLVCFTRPTLHDSLTHSLGKLERIEKSLEMFLQTKRQFFPRYNFLSDDDLLALLGQSRQLHAIQAQVSKCFDTISRLEITNFGASAAQNPFPAAANSSKLGDIIGIHSFDGEFLQLLKPVAMDGAIEQWMAALEEQIHETLKLSLVACVAAQRKTKKDRWWKDWCGQLVLTASLIHWTADTTRSLMELTKAAAASNAGKDAAVPSSVGATKEVPLETAAAATSIKTLKLNQSASVRRLAEVVRLPHSSSDREKLIALITAEVHARDILDRLIRSNCHSHHHFLWTSQLRFFLRDGGSCWIQQLNGEFPYGYEYLGNHHRFSLSSPHRPL